MKSSVLKTMTSNQMKQMWMDKSLPFPVSHFSNMKNMNDKADFFL